MAGEPESGMSGPVSPPVGQTGNASALRNRKPYERCVPRLDQIPPALRDQSIWCCWRYERKPGKPKPGKVPFSPLTYGSEGWNRDGFCTDAARAIACANEYQLDGIGTVGVASIDVDRPAVNPHTGDVEPWAIELVREVGGYAEVSVGHTGLHLLPLQETDWGGHTGNRDGMEVYATGSKQFLVFSGLAVPGAALESGASRDPHRADRLIEVAARYLPAKPQPTATTGGLSASIGMPPVDKETILARLSPFARRLIAEGVLSDKDPGAGGIAAYGGDRSIAVYAAIKDLIRAGADDETLLDLLTDPRNGISRCPLSKRIGDIDGAREWLRPQIGKARVEISTEAANDPFMGLIEEAANDPFTSMEADTEQAATAEPQPGRLMKALITVGNFAEALRLAVRQPWLIEGWIPGGGALVAMVGKPKSGKSFVCVDAICTIAAGLPEWHGAAVTGGRVLYIAAEGQRGVPVRIAAWLQDHGLNLDGLPGLDILPIPVALDNPEAFAELADVVKATARRNRVLYRLIVVDTLARSMTGDENSTPDMNAVVNACDRISRGTKATVLLVHHLGKDGSKGARGSSALPGAVDVQIDVSCDRMLSAPVKVEVSLAKDAEPPAALSLRARPVELNGLTDTRGRPVSTLVLGEPNEADMEAALLATEEARQAEAAARDALVRLITERCLKGERVHTATAGAFTAYAALRDDPHYPPGVGARRLAELLRELEREGRLMVLQYRKSNRDIGTCWAPAEPEAQAA